VVTTERAEAKVLDGTTEKTVGSDIDVVLSAGGDAGTETHGLDVFVIVGAVIIIVLPGYLVKGSNYECTLSL
jgi:hypothetical protein